MVLLFFHAGLPLNFGKSGPPPQNDQPDSLIARSNVATSFTVVPASTPQSRCAGDSDTTFGGSCGNSGASSAYAARADGRMRGPPARDDSTVGSAPDPQ